jgi:hypothetical protein
MGWFTRGTEADMGKGTLTEAERIALGKLEAAVQAGVSASMTVLEAGKALSEIRSRQLYRDSAATWEEYVHQRFGITPRRANQLVQFAGVSDALTEMGTAVPILSERAARPLVGLSPEAMSEAITEAAGSADGITPATIRKAASKRKKTKAAKVPKPRRFKVAGAVVVVTFNRKSNGSAIDALEAAYRQAEEELERQATEAA